MLTDDSGLLRKMIGNMTLSDAQKDEFLKGKLNKDVLDKILNVKVNEKDHADGLPVNSVFNFLSSNNLQSTHIDGHFRKICQNSKLSDSDLKAKEELKRLQRLHHLLPRNAAHISPSDSDSLQVSDIFLKLWMLPHLGKLKNNKSDAISTEIPPAIDSAHSIKSMGRKSWLKNYANYLGGEAVANEIYDNAARVSAQTMVLLSSYLDHINAPMHVLPGLDPSAPAGESLGISTPDGEIELPTWKELFGSLDFCQCEHCNSVYGPAAYFVDLLHFLDTNGDASDKIKYKTVLDVLFKRRKDLGNIRLNCANTETPMPYIDLINEILEWAVVNKELDFSYQTTRTAEELKVSPENIQSNAYETLKKAVYPFDLPFDLWKVQADAYLENIGIQRHEIMRTLQSDNGPSDVEIAAVHLGLTPRELKIITGASVDGQDIYNFWGLGEKNFDSLKDGNNLSLLLRQTGLSYEEFSRILDARFIDPERKIQIVFCQGGDCNLDKAKVGPLADDFFIRLHRFVRLNNKLGWTVVELDRALSVFSATTPDELNSGVIIKLSILKQLSAEFSLSVDECLSWWSEKMDTFGDEETPSLYERVFLDRAQSSETFKLSDKKDELALTSGDNTKIRDHITELLGPLTISSEDLRLLLNPDEELNLSSLSMLYRNISLSRALGLGISEFLSLKSLSGIDPFKEPEKTVKFWENLFRIQSSNFSIADLDYLIRDISPASCGSAPSDDQIISALSSMREELRKIESKYIKQSDTKGEAILRHLSTYLDVKEIDAFKKMVEKNEIDESISKKLEFLEFDINKFKSLSYPEEIYSYIQKMLLDYERKDEERKLIVAKISEVFQLDPKISEILVQELKGSDLSKDLESLIIGPDLLKLYNRFNKASLIIKGFNLSYEGINHQETIFLKNVPISKLILSPTMDDLLKVMDWAEFRDSLSKDALTKLFHPKNIGSATDEYIAYLTDLTGWNNGDLKFLCGSEAYNYAKPDFQSLEKILLLKRTFDLLKRLGINSQTLWSWGKHDIAQSSAEAIISVVKSKYSEDQWPELTKTLRNSLREQQRNAL